jgi:RNA polymerase sigma-70 factor (ECF subfamily)
LPDEAIEDNRFFAGWIINQLYQAIDNYLVDRAVIMLYLEEKSYQEIAWNYWNQK